MTIELTINSINYRETLEKMIPVIMRAAGSIDRSSFAVRLILRLGEDDTAGRALIGIADRLTDEDKREVICGAVNSYPEVISRKINDELAARVPSVSLRSVSAYNNGEGIKVYLNDVSADIGMLVNDPAVSEFIAKKAEGVIAEKFGPAAARLVGFGAAGLVKTLVTAAPDKAEDIIIQTLNSGKFNDQITAAIEEAVSEWADIKIGSINIVRSTTDLPAIGTDLSAVFSAKWEDKLIDAIASFIREKSL